MSFSYPVFDGKGNLIRQTQPAELTVVTTASQPSSQPIRSSSSHSNNNRSRQGNGIIASLVRRLRGHSDYSNDRQEPLSSSISGATGIATRNRDIRASSTASARSETSTAPVPQAEPMESQDAIYYDVDRQLLLPANLSGLVPEPDAATDMHYPTVTLAAAAVVGIVIGIYKHRDGHETIPAILGYIVFVCFITKPFFQGLLNSARRSTFGLSADGQSLILVGNACLLLAVLLDYFGVGVDHSQVNVDDDGGIYTRNVFLNGPLPIIYATFAVVQTFLLTEQCAKLNPDRPQHTSTSTRLAIYAVYLVCALVCLLLAIDVELLGSHGVAFFKLALLATMFVANLIAYCMQAKLNLELQRFVGQDLAAVYLDLLGNWCLFAFVIASGAQAYSDRNNASDANTSAFSAGCEALLSQPLVACYSFFLGMLDVVFVMEFFMLLDGDPLDPGNESCYAACCMSASRRRQRRRATPSAAPASIAPGPLSEVYSNSQRCFISRATVDLDVDASDQSGAGADAYDDEERLIGYGHRYEPEEVKAEGVYRSADNIEDGFGDDSGEGNRDGDGDGDGELDGAARTPLLGTGKVGGHRRYRH